MERQHRRVGFGLRRELLDLVSLSGVGGMLSERFELVALEWL